jgi:hypothetical protein
MKSHHYSLHITVLPFFSFIDKFRPKLIGKIDFKWVLTNEEKRVRFKNFFKKKDELAMAGTTSEAAGSEAGRRGHPYERRKNKTKKKAVKPNQRQVVRVLRSGANSTTFKYTATTPAL